VGEAGERISARELFGILGAVALTGDQVGQDGGAHGGERYGQHGEAEAG